MSLGELSFVSQAPITSLPFTRYGIKLTQVVEPSEQARALGKLARELEWQYKSPVLADSTNSSILSSISLSSSDQYEILSTESIDLADPSYERFFFELCNSAIIDAFKREVKKPPRIDRYKKRIYSNESFSLKREENRDNEETASNNALVLENRKEDKIEGQKYLTFDFVRDQNQHLVLILDFASEYHSRLTIDQIGLSNLETGQKMVHVYA